MSRAGRALLLVLDSVGVGGAPDAAAFGDEGANTLGHVAGAASEGRADRAGLRSGPLRLPHLARLGLGCAARLATGACPPGLDPPPTGPAAGWGVAHEVSPGKDTPSGHWEMAGTPSLAAWGTFPDTRPCFPPDLIASLTAETDLPGILGDRHASGVAILEALGAEHLRTGKPICYTSVDSVFQIAAHADAFGLERLYDVCAVARRLCDPLRIGRVIARPFAGSPEAGFVRLAGRRDYAIPPPPGTLLDRLAAAGREVVTIGKLGDIFARRGVTRETRTVDNEAGIDAILTALSRLPPGGLVFANLVDFDTLFGHTRDVAGYAAALERFDRRLPAIEAALRPGDLAILTADHGNDPTFRGSDHTREAVPVLAFGPGIAPGQIGIRTTYADCGATLAADLGLAPLPTGMSFLPLLRSGNPA